MCDTLVAVKSATVDGSIIFGKNSDREPGEAQVVEHLPSRIYPSSSRLRCTFIEIEQAARTNEIIISRPFWMWGAEMGANEHGLVIGNEAVFTKLPVRDLGLTGMDLLRLALERTVSASEALKLITSKIGQHGQGGSCGYRNTKFRYHNSFIIADPEEAWVLETADNFWVAEKVRGIRTISNVLTIGKEFDLIGDGTYEFARKKGWCKSAADFDFAHAFGDQIYGFSSGGDIRRACTLEMLQKKSEKQLTIVDFFEALRSHNGLEPADGWRMKMPCAHSNWQITRQAGQTTGSMVSHLKSAPAIHWLTGTSSPCISVFKPLFFTGSPFDTGPSPAAGFDERSLFWRHEKLHRFIIQDYSNRRSLIDPGRQKLQEKSISICGNLSQNNCQEIWNQHLEALAQWYSKALKQAHPADMGAITGHYWNRQNRQDNL